jgi:P4 family phage/plasmid primase-like protien
MSRRLTNHQQFRDKMDLYQAMREEGFNPPNFIEPGEINRFSTNGKKSDKAGWVLLFADGKGAAFGCHRSGEKHNWQEARNKPFNQIENKKFKQDCIAANNEKEKNRQAGYKQSASEALAEWQAAAPAPASHQYLRRKGIQPNMSRINNKDDLLIPVYGANNELQSLQRISPDGSKRFFSGGKMADGYVWLGEPEDNGILIFCEGFATGDSLNRATGKAICICFSAGNLMGVALLMRKRYPKATFIFAADNDTETVGNPGRTKATEAAHVVSGTVVFPGSGDFNDMEQSDGLHVVRNYINSWLFPDMQSVQPVKVVYDAPCMLIGTDARDGTATTRPLSELGNAVRLLDIHAENLYYINDTKAWLLWRSGAWVWDVDGAIVRGLSAGLPQIIYREGSENISAGELFAKWSRISQKERTIQAAVSLLQDFAEVRLPLAALDADPFKVGFDQARQIIDLQTGEVRLALQSDLITKSINIESVGEASKAIRWQAFLAQIFNDDAELIDWIKRWCGYLLTGSTSEQILIFCFGLGANGKSVLGDILRYILGDYARSIALETITETKRTAGSASPDLAELIGARMVMSAETEDGAALAESLVKSLVSGDAMPVRKLYSAPVQFTPQFKLMILGNHKPVIKGNDHGIWRRIRLIPFNRIFTPDERDLQLSNKLKAEASHILAWMLQGCMDWQNRGLKDIPKIIQKATEGYHDEQDLIGNWIAECFDLSAVSETTS